MADLSVSVLPAIAEIEATAWDGCGAAAGLRGDPFTTHRFLAALEASGSVGRGTGWQPAHLVARDGAAVVGVAPLYLKTHSQGEYIFDHAWADAWERAGGDYYPKLQIAAPFSPVPGPRLLLRDPASAPALIAAVEAVTEQNGLSSAHATFVAPDQLLPAAHALAKDMLSCDPAVLRANLGVLLKHQDDIERASTLLKLDA